MASKYEVQHDGDVIIFRNGQTHRIRCCDCSLVHTYTVKREGQYIILAPRRDERRTAASRRRRAGGLFDPAEQKTLGYKIVRCKRR